MSRGVRIVLVDDSEIVLARLEAILEASTDLRVVRKLRTLSNVDLSRALVGADVALVDMMMPGRSGLAALAEVVRHAPVVVVSDAAEDGEFRREAMARGARAWMSKREIAEPGGEERLRAVVRDAAGPEALPLRVPVLLVAGSTGAHRALAQLAPAIATGAWRVVVLQHLSERGDAPFAAWLTDLGLPAALATEGRSLDPSCALVAPAGRQLRLDAMVRARLAGPGTELHAPSADVLLASAAHLRAQATAVILSGLGSDGARGAVTLAAAGGVVLVQSPSECIASSMPTNAMKAVPEARALSLVELARELAGGRRR